MKFRLKMTLSMLGLLSVLFGVGGSLLISISFRNALEREQQAAHNAYQLVLGTLQIVNSAASRFDYADISATLEQLSGQNAGAWTALRLSTAEESVYAYGPAGLSVPQESVQPGRCSMGYVSTPGGGHALALSGTLEAGGESLYLDLARDVTPLFETRRVQQQAYLRVFLLTAGLCALLSYSISRVLTQPLVSLSQASRDLASGRLSSRARVCSGDEIGLVARDFNTMAGALEGTISQLEDAVERQERFMGSFAHEMKTPMTSIIGYADLLRGQTLSPQEQAEAANYIVSEGKRLENLSQKLMDLLVLKQGTANFIPVRPAALIQGLAAHLGPLYARQGVTLTCECAGGACLMEPDLVKSLLVNLWDNALKAMDGRGGAIHVRSEMTPGGCRITVRDSGRGIPPDALARLTDPFYRVDKSRSREQGGAGLGLALCREIAALHGGGLSFESAPGQGTAVTVELRGGAA